MKPHFLSIYLVCVFVPEYIWASCVCSAFESQKRALGPLKLELGAVMSSYVDSLHE